MNILCSKISFGAQCIFISSLELWYVTAAARSAHHDTQLEQHLLSPSILEIFVSFHSEINNLLNIDLSFKITLIVQFLDMICPYETVPIKWSPKNGPHETITMKWSSWNSHHETVPMKGSPWKGPHESVPMKWSLWKGPNERVPIIWSPGNGPHKMVPCE